MATSNLKRIAAQTFATWLVGKVPSLSGKIHTAQEGPNERAAFPCVSILMRSMTFDPAQADELWWNEDTDDGKLLMNVGCFSGTCEVRVYAKSVAERESLEQQILHALMAEPMSPGVVSLQTPEVTVNSLVTLYQAPVAFCLDDAEWREEFAFENRRFSFIDLDAMFPALVTRDAYTIETLVTALNHDIDSDIPDEQVSINEDGDITQYTDPEDP